MTNKLKEDEKNEKIIRGLLKFPANKRCINCNSLGPQYVCTNFWTFICTNCGGLHREFTHRVKSISMAKFSPQEVIALQEGGNERAREIFLKEWDPQRNSYPDSSNLDGLRVFIKHVYVEKKYASGKNDDGPPRLKDDCEGYEENRRSDTRSGSRSPPLDESYCRYSGRPGSAERDFDRSSRSNCNSRSPGYNRGDHISSSPFELREERYQDDKAGNEVQNSNTRDSNFAEGFPQPGVSDNQKRLYISSPPMVRPVRDILGAVVPSLQFSDPPKVATSITRGSNDGNSEELKTVYSGSLIDFSADTEHQISVAGQKTFSQHTASESVNNIGWASFDVSIQPTASAEASGTGDLESVFSQLLVDAPASVTNPETSPASLFKGTSPASVNSFPKTNNGGQLQAVQHEFSQVPVATSLPATPLNTLVGSLNNQGSVSVLDGLVIYPSFGAAVSGSSQNTFDVKSNGRKELPMDLFTGLYSMSPAVYPGWQTQPHPSNVYRIQHPVVRVAAFPPLPVSTNPFDLANESGPSQGPMLHSSACLGTTNPLSLPNSSMLASVPSQWTSPQRSSYQSSGPYTLQQYPQMMPQQLPTMNQGSGVGSEGNNNVHGVAAINQLSPPTNSHVDSLNLFMPPVGGNPFG